jgi:hypothetical protein
MSVPVGRWYFLVRVTSRRAPLAEPPRHASFVNERALATSFPALDSPDVRSRQRQRIASVGVDRKVNMVTGPHRDAAVGTPEYKLTAVRPNGSERKPPWLLLTQREHRA